MFCSVPPRARPSCPRAEHKRGAGEGPTRNTAPACQSPSEQKAGQGKVGPEGGRVSWLGGRTFSRQNLGRRWSIHPCDPWPGDSYNKYCRKVVCLRPGRGYGPSRAGSRKLPVTRRSLHSALRTPRKRFLLHARSVPITHSGTQLCRVLWFVGFVISNGCCGTFHMMPDFGRTVVITWFAIAKGLKFLYSFYLLWLFQWVAVLFFLNQPNRPRLFPPV